MRRRIAVVLGLATAAVVLPGTSPPANAAETHELRIATMAPRGSGLVRTFQKWDRMMRNKTDGKVGLQVYPGGVAGDENVVVRKMRSGQLDGAAVTTTGLGMIVRHALVLSAPGVMQSYDQLDAVRKELEDKFDKMFESNGYKLLGWGDMGRLRLFSKQRVTKPSDLQKVRPWVWKDNPIMVHWLKEIGANGVPMGLPEVYSGLQTGMLDTVVASALSSVALQWFTKLDYVSDTSSGFVVGALVVKKERFEALPDEGRKLLWKTARGGSSNLRTGARKKDDRAYKQLLQRGLEKMSMSKHEDKWAKVAKQTRNKLAGRLYPKKLLDRVEKVAARHE